MATGWLDSYPVDFAGGDLFGDAGPDMARRWHAIAGGLSQVAGEDPAALQDAIGRHASELGLTFRVTGEDAERHWPLTGMPLVVGAEEWATIERGLVQRAELLERLAEDIYGDQALVANGHLPAAVIAGSPFFTRRMLRARRKAGQEAGHFISVYAADLARGPGGHWRVLHDRLRFADGTGYALENRLAMSRAAGSLLSEHHVRRHASFFSHLREGLAAGCRREQPRIALLTPGRYNQSYAEQAHLARYLGFPLVEGRDLTVIDERLFVGTIAGPKRVDAVWRWTHSNMLDPLTFDASSKLGVAGLFDAWSGGGVEIANQPGVEVLESPALQAFMPRLCRALMGEEPVLPNVATWWCGQHAEADTVAARFDELAILPAFGREVEGLSGTMPVAGGSLNRRARASLVEAMASRPMDYCAQEIAQLSTTPTIIDGAVVARPFTIRAFVARTADGGWTVMPGGFARLASGPGLPSYLMGEGELSADVWIVDEDASELQAPGPLAHEPPISRGGGILASQAADNLFWFGRYNERAETVVRVIRTILDSAIEADGRDGGGREGIDALFELLVFWGSVPPSAARQAPGAICGKALLAGAQAGSVVSLLSRRREVGLALRDRLARDFWRILGQPMPHADPANSQAMVAASRKLIEQFGALAGLIQENMVRGPAWRFLQLGIRIERAISLTRIVRELMKVADRGVALAALLDLADSQIVFRSRYLTEPIDAPVHDLVLLDPGNPRALVFQVSEIVTHLASLPSQSEDNLPEEPLRMARALHGRIQSATAADMTAAALAGVERDLRALSDAISARFFLQVERDANDMRSRLLG